MLNYQRVPLFSYVVIILPYDPKKKFLISSLGFCQSAGVSQKDGAQGVTPSVYMCIYKAPERSTIDYHDFSRMFFSIFIVVALSLYIYMHMYNIYIYEFMQYACIKLTIYVLNFMTFLFIYFFLQDTILRYVHGLV